MTQKKMKESFAAHFLHCVVLPKYQIISMSVTITLMTIFFTYVFSEFNEFEKRPALYQLNPRDAKSFVSSATQVKVGLHLNDFPEFDVRTSSFIFDGIIWFLFDQSAVSLETVDKFSFSRGTILQKSTPETKFISGNYFAQYDIRVSFKADLNQKYFPFDDHRIYIGVENRHVKPQEMIFTSSLGSFLYARDMMIIGWQPYDRSVESGYSMSTLDKFDESKNVYHPKLLFAIDFQRIGIQDILLIFIPLLLMLFMCLLGLGFDPPEDSVRILTLSLASITGLISYRFVLQSLTPQVGYFILSDCFFLLFLSLVFMNFFMGLILIHHARMNRKLIMLRGMLYLATHMIVIGTTYYLLFYWPYSS